ncbi:MAG: DUF4321 domain-containing protein [Negativicutes bacterium]|nr:DUF4321 domain-containing protein [Negativicutes bacterium]
MKQTRSWGMLLLLVLIGLVAGGLLGSVLGRATSLAWLDSGLLASKPVLDMTPVVVDLYACKITFALAIYPNLLSVLGIIAAIAIWRKI